VVPHINIRSPRLQPGKFVIGETKRLLQHYLPAADLQRLGRYVRSANFDPASGCGARASSSISRLSP
jgi:hypothetical protein